MGLAPPLTGPTRRVSLRGPTKTVLGHPVPGQTVGVSKCLTTHFASEGLFPSPAPSVNGLLVGRQVEVVAEGLPAHSAGVEPLTWLGGAGPLGLILRVGVVGLRVGLITTLTVGSDFANLCPVTINLPFPVEFTMPHQALCVSKLLPTQVAFIVLLPGVDRQMLGEVEGFPEGFSTDVASVGLFPGVDSVMASHGPTPPETLTAHITPMWSFRAVPTRPRTSPPSHDSSRVSLLARLTRTFKFGVWVAGVGQRHSGAAAGSVAFVHLGRGRRPAGGHPHVPEAEASQQTSDDVSPLLPSALTSVDVTGGGCCCGDSRHGTARDLILRVVHQG